MHFFTINLHLNGTFYIKVAFLSFNITLLPSKRKEKLIILFDNTILWFSLSPY